MYKNKQQLRPGIVQDWINRQLPSVSGLTFKLKPMQKAIITCNRQNDVLVNLPTGFGKSVLYQYQALLPSTKSLIVIVPLKALLWDSIVEANQLGISATELSSQNIDKFDILNPPKLLFATPERLYQNYSAYQTVANLAQANKIGLFVIDEAHCICQWGNDFRKDYAKLSSLREDFPGIRILAMTATAPPQVRSQISYKLKLKNCYFFFASYNRPNLSYQVMKTTKHALKNNIQDLVKSQFAGQSGIIYCQTIKLCEDLHSQLKKSMKCQMFHSKVAVQKRERILNQFKLLPGKIIIATICFGMGINKPDVRFVIHAGISFTIQNYYQESGRGGRDGKPARCILMSYPEQQSTLLFLLERTKKQYKTNSSIYKNRNIQLDSMLKYATNKGECRKRYMFKVMGEDYPKCINHCDICLQGGRIQMHDFTEKGLKILNCLVQSNSVLTKVQLRNVLKGKALNNKKNKSDKLKPIVGLLKNEKQEQIMQIIQQMINQNYFQTIIKKSRYGMIKRIIVNKRKSLNKILISRPVKVQVNKKDTMAEFIKKKQLLSELKKELQSQQQNNILANQFNKQKINNVVYQDPKVDNYDPTLEDDDMQQGVILSLDYYQNQYGQYLKDDNEQSLEFNPDSYQNNQIIDQEEGDEDNVSMDIDEYDIKNLLPQVELELDVIDDAFTEQCLYSKRVTKPNKKISQQKINGVWYQTQTKKDQFDVKIEKQPQPQTQYSINQKTVQNMLQKYGLQPRNSLKRQTEMPSKDNIKTELNNLDKNKKKCSFL